MARGIAHREWYVHREDYETEADFRAAVENEQALNVHIQERLGVAIVSAPVRNQDDFGRWSTEAYIFQTASVPAARPEQPAAERDEDYENLVDLMDDVPADTEPQPAEA